MIGPMSMNLLIEWKEKLGVHYKASFTNLIVCCNIISYRNTGEMLWILGTELHDLVRYITDQIAKMCIPQRR